MRKTRSDKGIEKKPIEEKKVFIQVGLVPRDWDHLRKYGKSFGNTIAGMIKRDRTRLKRVESRREG